LRETLCVMAAWKTARNDARSPKIRSRRVATRRGVSQSFPLSFDIARCFFVFAGEWGNSFACDIVTEIRPGMLTPEMERSAATGADKTPTLRGDAGVSLLIGDDGDRWPYILVASYTERTISLKYYPSTNLSSTTKIIMWNVQIGCYNFLQYFSTLRRSWSLFYWLNRTSIHTIYMSLTYFYISMLNAYIYVQSF